MPQIGTWLLANIFTALLPPLDKEEEDFYAILGVPRNATNEQIRKAYKVQSLKLHPDKVAQRKQSNVKDAAAKYERVQEAYGVLVNDDKRQRYRALQFSPSRYRFVNQGAFANPGAIYENLTNATTVDKTRLVVLCTVIILSMFVQPILIATKVNHVLEGGLLESSKWVVLLLPTWLMGALWVLFHCILMILTSADSKLPMAFLALEYLLWYIGVVLLAMKWDDSLSASYRQVLTPMYLAMFLRWISKGLVLRTIRRDVAHMVTVEYLEREVLKGKNLEEMTEAEQQNIRQTYIVVTVLPDFEPGLDNVETTIDEKGEPVNGEESIELQKVEASPEYDAAMDLYFTTMGGLVGSLVFGLVFMILLTLKLDRQIEASYWVVFIPLWIHYGSRWTYYCFRCGCGTVGSDEPIMHTAQQRQEQQVDVDEENGNARQSSSERPEDSNFLDPNASISKLDSNTPTTDEATEIATKPVVASGDSAPGDEKETAKATPEIADKGQATVAPGNAEEWKSDEGFDDENLKTQGDGDGIHIDEDTFHAWQSAYEEAERGAMEEQASAFAESCCLTVQLMVLIMVVAKIDDSYWDHDESSDVGFNTFWILFPFFLFFGLLLCCCACLIYGAEPGKASDLQGPTAAADGQQANETTAAPEPTIVTPPPPAPVETTETLPAEPSETPISLDEKVGEKPGATAPDMEDLD